MSLLPHHQPFFATSPMVVPTRMPCFPLQQLDFGPSGFPDQGAQRHGERWQAPCRTQHQPLPVGKIAVVGFFGELFVKISHYLTIRYH